MEGYKIIKYGFFYENILLPGTPFFSFGLNIASLAHCLLCVEISSFSHTFKGPIKMKIISYFKCVFYTIEYSVLCFFSCLLWHLGQVEQDRQKTSSNIFRTVWAPMYSSISFFTQCSSFYMHQVYSKHDYE